MLPFLKIEIDENSIIYDQIIGNPSSLFTESTLNNQKQQKNLSSSRLCLPIGQNGRFEAGYRGSFQKNLTDFKIIPNTLYSNTLEYNEIHQCNVYANMEIKLINSPTFLGLRYEDSNIDVNSITSNNYNNKKYNNFFPTATFNYEIQ